MMDKIKDFFKYIFAPLAALVAYILYVTTRTNGLESEIKRLKADKEADKLSEAFDRAKEKGNASENDWEAIRNQFIDTNDKH
jgi:hypothetical protein